jgi:cyclophilin family peptidyl-prolyl cis-trans isomerase
MLIIAGLPPALDLPRTFQGFIMYARHCLIVAICLAALSPAIAAPEKQKPAPAAPDFQTMFSEWKGLIEKMTQIRQRFQLDPNADKKALEAQFDETLETAKALSPKLTEAAEAAYLAAPNKNRELDDFLLASLRGLVAGDDFEEATKLAKILTDNNFEHDAVNYLAGVAFFASNDFENAGKYLKLANDSGTIDRTGRGYLNSIDKYKLLWEREKAIRATEDKADNLPQVKLTTSKGDIVILVLENEAPNTAANFINLVEKKYYDGLKFHRVIAGFMAQGGDPKGDGSGGPGYTIPDECRQNNHRIHFRGSLSMAKTQAPDTGGSQFFLTFVPTPHLDGQHTVFGRVIEGFDVLTKLKRIQPGEPGTPDKIIKAEVLRKRKHKYDPIKRLDK